MAKRKADSLHASATTGGNKKVKTEPLPKIGKANLLDDSDSGSDGEGGAKLDGSELKINEEFAKRFEHNKKREERARLDEKLNLDKKPVKGEYGDKYDEDSESSNDEDEDDDGFLATEALDKEISATLQALRSKDPRVYDQKVTFYAPIKEGDENEEASTLGIKEAKPMYLRDYHRENLLTGYTGEEEAAPPTYVQEQAELKKSIVQEMHAAVESSGDEDDFLQPKSKPIPAAITDQGLHPSRASKLDLDTTSADKDPETFLSNFMAARAWVPSDGARFQALESDDDEDMSRAEKFEEAYNMRFEDPSKSNETLQTYARDMIASKAVRREEPNSRKKARDAKRDKKEAEKKEMEEERAQLKRLKMEEMEEMLQKIKRAAGIRGKPLESDDWVAFLNNNWDNEDWETEMNRFFGESYYAEQEQAGSEGEAEKPEWDDDIDINDLIPDFEGEDESTEEPAFTLSEAEDEEEGTKKISSKDRQQDKAAKKKAIRIERKRIEELVESKMDIDLSLKSKGPARFRYRETSPTSYGLTSRDILMATDEALNEYAGLKKLASFRDTEKKRKDKKYLGKKARLRDWRKQTFGNEDGPEIVISANADATADAMEGVAVEGEKKKKKRSRKAKVVVSED